MRPLILAVTLALLVQAGVAGTTAGSGTAKAPPPPQTFVIGLSPYLDRSVKDEVYRSVVRLLVEDLPLNSTVAIYDAFQLHSVAQITLPDARAFASPKTRANQFAPAIHDLKVFLAQEHPKPTSPRLDFKDAIRLPQFCRFLADNLAAPQARVPVLLIGSPLYQDAQEPAFSMTEGYFPSDGNLLAPEDRSVFGFSGGANALPHLALYWVYFGDPWLNDLHQEKVTRFWTLFLARRAAQLVTLSGDLPTAVAAFRRRAAGADAASRAWTIDTRQTKVEMLRLTRTVPATDWITRDTLLESAPPPPSGTTGPLKIGIRWQEDIDLDLYATPHPGARTLFFQHPRSSEGYYYKDHRSSPGRDYEFIEFDSPVDVREVAAFVNFYQGASARGPSGEVRLEFAGRIYRGSFSLRATHGNLGRTGAAQEPCWTRLPLEALLGIGTPSHSTAASAK